MLLRILEEIGTSGSKYHLAAGKVIDVSETEAERLLEAYPEAIEIVEEE